MADWPGIYNTGTATVAANGTTVTFQNAGNIGQAVRPGDRFGSHKGLGIRIASISGTTATLAQPWPGAAQTAASYEIAFTPYDGGYRQALQTLLETFGASGNLLAFAGLTGEIGKLPIFTGAGAMALVDLDEIGGDVASVNGRTGAIVLNAEDVGAYSQSEADARFTTVATDRAQIKGLNKNLVSSVFLKEAGREGRFTWQFGNFSSQVTADAAEGIYIKANDVAATIGAWVRDLGPIPASIKYFGAKGDGATDDTAAFQAAFALGIPIVVPRTAAAYIVGAAAIDLISGSWVQGLNRPTIRMKANAPAFAMFVATQQRRNNIRICGLVLDGNRQNNIDHGSPDAQGNQPAGWQGRTVALVNVAYVDGFVLEDCEIKNCMSSGLWMSDCTAYRITDNWVHDYRHTGIATRNDSSIAGTTEKGIVSGNICEGGTVGIHSIFGVINASVVNNVCRNNKDANRFPSYAYSGTYPNVWPSTGGFKASGASGYVSPALSGDGAGIECTGVHNPPATSNQNLTITGNNCAGNMTGIRLEEVTMRCVVTGNKCTGNEAHGIFVYASYYHAITGNSCTDNGMDGVHLEAFNGDACDCHAITGNVCTQNGRFGAYLGGASNNVVSGNVLCPNNTNAALTGGGLGLFTANGMSCQRNAITGNNFPAYTGQDKYGIYSDSGSGGTTHQNNRSTGNVFVGQTVAASNLNTSLNPVI